MRSNWDFIPNQNRVRGDVKWAGRIFGPLCRLGCVAILAALCAGLPARAQVSASIKGIVTDASGGRVAAAKVTVKNVETGAVRNSVTDDAGRFIVLSLMIGEYEVSVSKQGFQYAVRAGINLVVGQEASVDFKLEVSGVKTEVNVTADAPIV